MKNPSQDNPLRDVVEGRADWSRRGPMCPRCKQSSSEPSDECSFCGYSFRQTRAFEVSGAETASTLIGETINEKYRVVSVLGEGGFGVVYKVELLLFDRQNIFALKLLHPGLSGDQEFRRRFLREAALAMQLIHENTIQIREFGRTEEGHLFFTMDYCEGEPLNRVLSREGFLTVNRALAITLQVLSVMQLAHSRGIIHRDLKPENIFLDHRGRQRDFVKVGDFGLAKTVVNDDAQSGITRGGILGTPRYMSPEQRRGAEDLDHCSDLYSVGVVLYEMLYGDVPAERGLTQDKSGYPTPPPQPGHVVPRAVWEVVRKAIQPAREDRFQSAEEFTEAVRALPVYTPSYLEPVDPRSARAGAPWWSRLASAVSVLLVVGAVLSFTLEGSLADLWRGAPEGLPASDGTAAGGAQAAGNTALELSPGPSLATDVRAWVLLKEGDVFEYRVDGPAFPSGRKLRYEVTEEVEPGRFRVHVSPGDREVQWVIDPEENVFRSEFLLPDPDTGELTLPGSEVLLALPADAPMERDLLRFGLEVHARLRDLPGRFERCLVAERVEGGQRFSYYFQEGRGLVALEARAIPVRKSGEPPLPAGETLVYRRTLITEAVEDELEP